MKPRSHRWIVWLLPFLVARAFVPAGFMLSAVSGELSLMFCPGVVPAAQVVALQNAVPADEVTHAHHHAHGEHAQGQPAQDSGDQHSNHLGASDTSMCPFAVAAAACAGAEAHFAHDRLESASDLLPDYVAPADANRPIRADRIRGPPTLLAHV